MDTEGLLKSLNAHDVHYVIIGAIAFPIHGYSRATLDIDILISLTEENARKTLNALKDFGYEVSDITVSDLLSKKMLIRQYELETDIHPFVKGITVAEIWKNKVAAKIGETPCYFASLEDLIKNEESGRQAKKQRRSQDIAEA